MKPLLLAAGLGLALLASVITARADQYVNLSVKVICKPDGTRPFGGIATRVGFDVEVAHGNNATIPGYGYRLRVVEFEYISPPVPAGVGDAYWFNAPARSTNSKAQVASAVASDPETWRWSEKAINIYVNNTSAGICSFPNDRIVLVGKEVVAGTIVHEVGHYFNLRHTHPGDSDLRLDGWGDGDGLPETLEDDPDATLSDINARYPDETEQKRLDLFQNVMSYHELLRFLPAQIAVWDAAVRTYPSRQTVLSPVTLFVATNGDDVFGTGLFDAPFRTVPRAGQLVAAQNQRPPGWTIMLVGSADSPPSFSAGSRYETPSRLQSFNGPARLVR